MNETKKSRGSVRMDELVVLILSHGRADNVKTHETLRRYGYTGRIVIVCDDKDASIYTYKTNFGAENVYVFNKDKYVALTDTLDNFGGDNVVVFARNACFDIAKDLGYKYFMVLDDDYYCFSYKYADVSSKKLESIDDVFLAFATFVRDTPILCAAFSQGGDHFAGDKYKTHKRKAMNSFMCCTERPFKFDGRINEDTNAYVHLGSQGHVFLTIYAVQLDQYDTQQNKGGLTDAYLKLGTYVKSFYTVIQNPSCVNICALQSKNVRLHHRVNWERCCPKIISEEYKKQKTDSY